MGKKIMVVEDEKHFHDLYSLMLEGTDYEIIQAYDGEEALLKLEQEKPDLIILDIILDMVTGDTLFLYLKSIPEYEKIPVMIVSNTSSSEYKNLSIVDPNLVFIDKVNVRERLIDEVKVLIG